MIVAALTASMTQTHMTQTQGFPREQADVVQVPGRGQRQR